MSEHATKGDTMTRSTLDVRYTVWGKDNLTKAHATMGHPDLLHVCTWFFRGEPGEVPGLPEQSASFPPDQWNEAVAWCNRMIETDGAPEETKEPLRRTVATSKDGTRAVIETRRHLMSGEVHYVASLRYGKQLVGLDVDTASTEESAQAQALGLLAAYEYGKEVASNDHK